MQYKEDGSLQSGNGQQKGGEGGRYVLVNVTVEDVGHAVEQTFAIHVPVIQLCITSNTPKHFI